MLRRFEDFTLDLATGDLRLRGRPVEIEPKAAKLLAMLVRRPGRLVPRDEVAHRRLRAARSLFAPWEKRRCVSASVIDRPLPHRTGRA